MGRVSYPNYKMSIEFIVKANEGHILIQASGSISTADIKEMRIKTVELLNETGIKNYVVDLSKLISIEELSTYTTYMLGKEFKNIKFPLSTKTAVILPVEEATREQVKFMHIVEINRMRGPLEYVTSYEEALEWFGT